jgi:hypothetical protein
MSCPPIEPFKRMVTSWHFWVGLILGAAILLLLQRAGVF